MARPLTIDERRLVLTLLEKTTNVELPADWLDRAKVVQMDDGGMGSLRFLPSSSEQKMGRQAAEVRFRDVDGIDVIASLNLDEAGVPFELDVWKVDFNPLIRIPDHF